MVVDQYSFEDIFINTLNTYVSIKTKIIRANNKQFMTKALRKAIITRSRLMKVYLKNQNTTNWNSSSIKEIFVLIYSEK